jgi:hypothetical protein
LRRRGALAALTRPIGAGLTGCAACRAAWRLSGWAAHRRVDLPIGEGISAYGRILLRHLTSAIVLAPLGPILRYLAEHCREQRFRDLLLCLEFRLTLFSAHPITYRIVKALDLVAKFLCLALKLIELLVQLIANVLLILRSSDDLSRNETPAQGGSNKAQAEAQGSSTGDTIRSQALGEAIES